MKTIRVFFAVATAVALAAPAAQAQRGNASDVGGGRAPRRVVFTNGAELGAASGNAGAAGAVNLSMAPIVQQAGNGAAQLVAQVAAARSMNIELVDALLSRDGAPSARQVERFAAQYTGVLNEPTSRRIAATVAAFNALVDDASPAYLTKPPAEFVAAQAVLQQLVEQTSRR